MQERPDKNLHLKVLKNIVKQLQKIEIGRIYQIYFRTKNSQEKFYRFIDTQLFDYILGNRRTHLENFTKLVFMKCLKNPAYDFESAIQCLDLAPLTDQQLR